MVYERFPRLRSVKIRQPVRCPVGEQQMLANGPCADEQSRASCCSMSRPWVCRRCSSAKSSRSSRKCQGGGTTVLLVEQELAKRRCPSRIEATSLE